MVNRERVRRLHSGRLKTVSSYEVPFKGFNVLCKAALNDSKVFSRSGDLTGLPGILKAFLMRAEVSFETFKAVFLSRF